MTLLIGVLLLSGCNPSRTYFPNKRDLEPKHIQIVRFDSALMSVQSATTAQDIRRLYTEYPVFMPVFTEDILGIPATDTAYLEEALPAFLADTVYGFAKTNLLVEQQFADISGISQSIDDAFARLCYLYPETELPIIYLFISGFNSSIYFTDNIIGIGTDMYLGSDYELYNRVVYDYQKQTMRKECIPADIVSAYLFRNLPYTSSKNRLIDQMIYRGKVMYLLAQLFPTLPDYEIMGYTKEQWQWCVKNEKAIWHLVMDKRDLFKTESIVLTSYLNDGPFTAEISQDSPGRVGTWIGWRIAESYMTHNQDISLQELMAEPDAQLILEKSFYKP
ncbi:MAG: hypothetical protein ACI30A_05185 [Paludibacteraceae bacterium]